MVVSEVFFWRPSLSYIFNLFLSTDYFSLACKHVQTSTLSKTTTKRPSKQNKKEMKKTSIKSKVPNQNPQTLSRLHISLYFFSLDLSFHLNIFVLKNAIRILILTLRKTAKLHKDSINLETVFIFNTDGIFDNCLLLLLYSQVIFWGVIFPVFNLWF